MRPSDEKLLAVAVTAAECQSARPSFGGEIFGEKQAEGSTGGGGLPTCGGGDCASMTAKAAGAMSGIAASGESVWPCFYARVATANMAPAAPVAASCEWLYKLVADLALKRTRAHANPTEWHAHQIKTGPGGTCVCYSDRNACCQSAHMRSLRSYVATSNIWHSCKQVGDSAAGWR